MGKVYERMYGTPAEVDPLLTKERQKLRTRLRFNRRRRPPPPKTTLAAAIMLVGGTLLGLLGMMELWEGDSKRGRALLIIGGILLLPGNYATINIVGTYLGWPGYSYGNIPSYDD